jgi:CheY-like chemotaxis protein
MNPIPQQVILMADDDADDRLLVKDALGECQLTDRLIFVENGEELMDYLLRRGNYGAPDAAPRPGLILLDLNMPRKDGREALREIRAHPDLRRIPVVAFTTSKADTDVGAIYDLGANSFISKPVAFDALVNVMRALAAYWFGIVELPSRAGDYAEARARSEGVPAILGK